MIIAHTGGWKQWEMVYDLLAGEDVYLDLSFTFPYAKREILLKILEKHDKNKLLFATDSPWGNAKSDIECVRKLSLSDTDVEQILSGNAKRLLGL